MKKRKIIHSALSLSLTAALCLSMAACGGTQTPADSVAASQPLYVLYNNYIYNVYKDGIL